MEPGFEWLKFAAYSVFAGIGGALGYVMRSIDARVKIVWWMVIVQGVAASFVGLLTLLLCISANFSPPLTGVTVGVLGWLGSNATIGILSKFVFAKLGLSTEQQPIRGREDDV